MRILILSDIHGNLSALDSVLKDSKRFTIDAIAILGDLIDYGMRSNEVVNQIRSFKTPLLCNIWGNHEHAIMTDDYSHFSSIRGADCARYTKKLLSSDSIDYLNNMDGKSGISKFKVEGKSFLAVHGCLKDHFWGTVSPDGDFAGYEKYDYVLSGHSHLPHCFSFFYKCNNEEYRNKKRTVFINPGSVGQPRNHNPKAQYAVLDTDGDVRLLGTDYNIKFEQSLYTQEIDSFYRVRLTRGV